MYDLIVIGGGPGGGAAAERAADERLSTVLFEERHLGGVCLNEGCIPSKSLLNCAKLYSHARHSATFGVRADNVTFDLAAAMAWKTKLVERLRKAQESAKRKRGVQLVMGRAEILPPAAGVLRVKSGEKVFEAARLLLAAGSEAIRPPIPGADQPFVYTNREMLAVNAVPSRLVIIGGGIIGLEFATIFAEIGSSVTVVEMLPAIAGQLDNEIRAVLQKELEKKGVAIKLNARVTRIGDHEVEFEDGAKTTVRVPADIVLMSVGRRPTVKGFGLENLNVAVERGAVAIDDQGRTSVPNVFAAGDITGKLMLAHTASRQADVCVDTMLGRPNAVRYETIPSVIYTHPEVASVGLTKEQAEAGGRAVAAVTLPLTYSGRYMAETENGRGIIKVVVDRGQGTILGVHMIGGECSEMIHGATIMIEAQLRVKDVRDIVFAHPTVAEVMKEAIAGIRL